LSYTRLTLETKPKTTTMSLRKHLW